MASSSPTATTSSPTQPNSDAVSRPISAPGAIEAFREVPVDHRLLAAMQHGLPDCAGVAIGVDRLVMLAAGANRIDEVIAFPVDRA